MAVTGGVCDFRRDLRAGLLAVENLLVSWLAQNTQVQWAIWIRLSTNDEKPLENSLLMWDFSQHHALLPVYLIKASTFTSAHNTRVVGWRRDALIRPTDRAMSISERVGLAVSEAIRLSDYSALITACCSISFAWLLRNRPASHAL